MAASHFRCRRFAGYDIVMLMPPFHFRRHMSFCAMPLPRCRFRVAALLRQRYATRQRDATRTLPLCRCLPQMRHGFSASQRHTTLIFQDISPPPSRFAADISAISFHSLFHLAILFAFRLPAFITPQ
jgi:hypothetical protein